MGGMGMSGRNMSTNSAKLCVEYHLLSTTWLLFTCYILAIIET